MIFCITLYHYMLCHMQQDGDDKITIIYLWFVYFVESSKIQDEISLFYWNFLKESVLLADRKVNSLQVSLACLWFLCFIGSRLEYSFEVLVSIFVV